MTSIIRARAVQSALHHCSLTYSPNFCMAAIKFLFDPDDAGMQNEFTAAEISSGDSVNSFAIVDDTVQCVMCASAAALCG